MSWVPLRRLINSFFFRFHWKLSKSRNGQSLTLKPWAQWVLFLPQTYLLFIHFILIPERCFLLILQKWIPSIKEACVTLTIYLEPKVHYLTEKSIEVLSMSKQAFTPHIIQGFDVSRYYLEVSIVYLHFLFIQLLLFHITLKHLRTIACFFLLGNQDTYIPIHKPNYDHSETTLGESTSRLRAIYRTRKAWL